MQLSNHWKPKAGLTVNQSKACSHLKKENCSTIEQKLE